MTRPLSRTSVAAMALAVGIGVSACSPAQVGAAALVDDQRISVTELQAATRELSEAKGRTSSPAPEGAGAESGPGADQRTVLNRLIVSDLMDNVAEREGVRVSDGDIDALDAQFERLLGADRLRQELIGVGVPPGARREFLRFQALRLALGRKLAPGSGQEAQSRQVQAADSRLARGASEVPVEVNPRYGRWLPAEVRVEGAVSGGLSKTPSELAPSAKP